MKELAAGIYADSGPGSVDRGKAVLLDCFEAFS